MVREFSVTGPVPNYPSSHTGFDPETAEFISDADVSDTLFRRRSQGAEGGRGADEFLASLDEG